MPACLDPFLQEWFHFGLNDAFQPVLANESDETIYVSIWNELSRYISILNTRVKKVLQNTIAWEEMKSQSIFRMEAWVDKGLGPA